MKSGVSVFWVDNSVNEWVGPSFVRFFLLVCWFVRLLVSSKLQSDRHSVRLFVNWLVTKRKCISVDIPLIQKCRKCSTSAFFEKLTFQLCGRWCQSLSNRLDIENERLIWSHTIVIELLLELCHLLFCYWGRRLHSYFQWFWEHEICHQCVSIEFYSRYSLVLFG